MFEICISPLTGNSNGIIIAVLMELVMGFVVGLVSVIGFIRLTPSCILKAKFRRPSAAPPKSATAATARQRGNSSWPRPCHGRFSTSILVYSGAWRSYHYPLVGISKYCRWCLKIQRFFYCVRVVQHRNQSSTNIITSNWWPYISNIYHHGKPSSANPASSLMTHNIS